MVELTRIITVEITCIGDRDNAVSKEEAKNNIIDGIKMMYDADDVVVTNIQDFELEKK